MKKRVAFFSTVLIGAFLLCCPLAFADEGGSPDRNLAVGLAIGVVVLSGIIMTFANMHFKKKREAAQRRNRQNAKRKKNKKR